MTIRKESWFCSDCDKTLVLNIETGASKTSELWRHKMQVHGQNTGYIPSKTRVINRTDDCGLHGNDRCGGCGRCLEMQSR